MARGPRVAWLHNFGTGARPARLSLAACAHAAALASLAGLPMGVWAQSSLTPAPAAIDRANIDGRDFAGVAFPAMVQDLALSMAAVRVWTWSEGNTTRLLLDRDVRVNLGTYRFTARRALVWIEPVLVDGQPGEQVAFYFDSVLNPAGAPSVTQSGDRLLVTAIIRTPAPDLRADRLYAERPIDSFIDEGEARLARYLLQLLGVETVPAADVRPRLPGYPTDPTVERELLPPEVAARLGPDLRGPLPPATVRSPLLPERGSGSALISIAGSPRLVDDGGERAIVIEGGAAVQLQVLDGSLEAQLAAERAVVFMAPGEDPSDDGAMRFDAGRVRGIYLEGDARATTVVYGDGGAGSRLGEARRYELRGQRLYYDVTTRRALVLNAVFWTYDEQRGMPLYVRANAIRQENERQWSAERATFANVAFAEPHFSIGATDLTISSVPREAGRSATTFDVRGVAFRAGGLPLLWLPRVSGEMKPAVLRDASVDSVSGDTAIRTSWDLYALMGLDPRPGNDLLLLLDGYPDRGVGVGAEAQWSTVDMRGSLYSYYINDSGRDRMPSGARIDRDNENRGMLLAEQIYRINEEWTLFTELSYISDEAFVSAFYDELAEERREFASSAYLRRLRDNEYLTLELRGTLNDFIANEYLLQSRGYQTERLPELTYGVVGADLLGGALSYTGDLRLSRLSLQFHEPKLRNIGLDSLRRAQDGFGLTPDDRLSDSLRAAGYSEDAVLRADTRHEFAAPFSLGALNVTPFAVGRATAYDESFDEFGGQDDDVIRLWGAGGVRIATTIQRVDNSVRSRALDLSRMRHLIEPSLTLWSSATDVPSEDLPVYDEDVEALADGTTVRAGVRNTLQTQRGGPARWRSVDWFTLNTDYIWASGDTSIDSPFGRFIESRPELSNLGEFATTDATLYPTDALALTGSYLHNVEESELARVTAGAIIDHGFGFSTYMGYRDEPPIDATLLDFGARYELTTKYAITGFSVYDTGRDEFQSVGGTVLRRFPQWTVGVSFDVDNIADVVSFGVSARPVGVGGEYRDRVFTRDLTGATSLSSPRIDRSRLDSGPFAEE